MENTISFLAIILQVIFWIASLIAIIYFGYKAYKKKGKEGFEQRDN
jgi:hypothetical protein